MRTEERMDFMLLSSNPISPAEVKRSRDGIDSLEDREDVDDLNKIENEAMPSMYQDEANKIKKQSTLE